MFRESRRESVDLFTVVFTSQIGTARGQFSSLENSAQFPLIIKFLLIYIRSRD